MQTVGHGMAYLAPARWHAACSADPQEGSVRTGDIVVRIAGLRNDRGVVHLALFDGPRGFPTDGPHAFRRVTLPILDGSVEHRFVAVPYGTYAISFLHDEVVDGTLSRNVIGIPREGFGASNDARTPFGAPRYEDARFEVGAAEVRLYLRPEYWL